MDFLVTEARQICVRSNPPAFTQFIISFTVPNELCDFFANLLRNVCHDVEVKVHLQPLQGQTFAPTDFGNPGSTEHTLM